MSQGNRHFTHIVFFLFGIMHALSYTTSIMFGITLDYERAVYGLLLVLLFYKYIDKPAIYFNIFILYASIFAAFLSSSINGHISDALGFILYYNVVYIYWKYLSEKISDDRVRLSRLYIFLSIPLFIYISPMLFNPFLIRLDFYTDPSLEEVGLKSRTVGWAAACCVPMLFIWARRKGVQRIFIILLTALMLVLVIGSGSRSSITGVFLFIIITIIRSDIRYKIYWTFLSLIFAIFIISNSDDLSLTRRSKLQEMGVSDDTFRLSLTTEFFKHLPNDFPSSLLPAGFGYDNIQFALNEFFDTKGFGTHNTYITIFLALGILSIILFVKFFKGVRFLVQQKQGLNYVPFFVISLTEDCFGPGQLLFLFFIAILAVSSK